MAKPTARLLVDDEEALLQEDDGAIILDPYKLWSPAPRASTLAEIILKGHRPVSQVSLFSPDLGSVLATLTPLDGSVTMERTRDTHRTATFTVADRDGTLTDELLVPDRMLRIERGAYLGDVPQLAALITGRITEVSERDASGVVSVSVESRLSLLSRPWVQQTTFDVGLRLTAVARAVAESAGYGTDDALYDLQDEGRSLAVARTYDIGGDMLADLVALFADYGLDLWDTGAGVMVSRQSPDPTTVSVAWEFDPLAEGTLVLDHEAKRSAPQAGINRVRVTGRGPDGYPIFAEVRITDASHPLAWSESLDLPRYIDRPEIATVDACLAVARQALLDGSTVSVSHSFSSAAVPPLFEEGRPVVRLGPDRLRIDRATIPLYKGGMTGQAATVRAI